MSCMLTSARIRFGVKATYKRSPIKSFYEEALEEEEKKAVASSPTAVLIFGLRMC